MILSIVAAACENDAIGKDNKLVFRLPKDFDRMKVLTKGKPLIMGRKTHESIGRPLPGRRNIIITRQDQSFEGCETAHSLEEAVRMAEEGGAAEAIIFGGAEIYKQSMSMADKIFLTRIHASPEGDSFFPTVDSKEWKEVSRERHEADSEHPVAFSFVDYERI